MRYARHISLSEVGEAGQQKLLDAKVLIIGAGGLGCPALQYLVAAGVGTIGIVDGDTVDETNLQRQVLFTTNDIGRSKALVAKEKLNQLNPDVTIQIYQAFLTANNALEIIREYDLIIDGTDNFATRYLVNDACVKLNKPFVYGAIHKFEGQVSVFNWNSGPTYRCLFPEPPTADQIPNCAEAGVLGVLPGVIGTLQATEAMKVILGIGEPLSGKLKMVNLLTNSEQVISFSRNEQQVEKARQINLANSYTAASCSSENEVNVVQFQDWLETGKDINILDVREVYETPKLEVDVISIQLGEIPSRFKELPTDKPLIVVCQKGIRSLRAIEFLRENNFQNQLINLKGGMAAFHQQAIQHE
ncbi:MAG: molybdopterin-synthase adenylyltransferase MoeB [Flavobacteriales bacterium]|nr:molybdopterin-synthase adenylyltransferase MoeB [Flavobacteriales bacterium]